jgi:DNA-binding protein Fis
MGWIAGFAAYCSRNAAPGIRKLNQAIDSHLQIEPAALSKFARDNASGSRSGCASGGVARTCKCSLRMVAVVKHQTPIAQLVGHTVAEVERDLILHTLSRHSGSRTRSACVLGLSVRTLRNKIREYATLGIDVPAPGRSEPRAIADGFGQPCGDDDASAPAPNVANVARVRN